VRLVSPMPLDHFTFWLKHWNDPHCFVMLSRRKSHPASLKALQPLLQQQRLQLPRREAPLRLSPRQRIEVARVLVRDVRQQEAVGLFKRLEGWKPAYSAASPSSRARTGRLIDDLHGEADLAALVEAQRA